MGEACRPVMILFRESAQDEERNELEANEMISSCNLAEVVVER